MKNLLFAFLTLFAINYNHAQWWEDGDDDGSDSNSENYDVLQVLWADENYEKLLKLAERFTMKDATKNDPEPYLWLARALFAMSKDENYTMQDKYKKAYNDALSWLSKYYKKAAKVEPEVLEPLLVYHQTFFIEIKRSLYELIEIEIMSDNYAKALGLVSKMPKVTPDNFAKEFLAGACNYQKGDKTSARDLWKKAETELAKLKEEDFDNWDKPDKMFLALGLVETAKCHVKAKKPELAREMMMKYKDWFEDFDVYTDYLEEL